MPKRTTPLTDTQIRNAKPQKKEIKLFDGGGLFLLVTPAGGKLWRLKYRFDGKEKKLSLGAYPEISLLAARQKRDEARTQLAQGIDPGQSTTESKKETFEEVALEWHKRFSPQWDEKTGKKIFSQLEKNVFLIVGTRPINVI